MSGAEGERPIIIINKKSHGGHGHHGGSWKVAIADLMTAMMALFMVLWLIAQSPETRASVGAYFRDPLGLAGGGNTDTNTGPRGGGSSFFDGGNTAISEDLVISPGNPRWNPSSSEQNRLFDQQRAIDRLAQALMKLRQDAWSRHVELTAAEEGVRIEIQDTEDESLFPKGGSKINVEFATMLKTIAGELGGLPNHVVIEGHTDATPASSRRQTNWEISTQRANAARRFLVANGLREEQVEEVRGYAAQRLRLWHDPKNPRNRRISVLVMMRRGHRPKLPDEAPPEAHHLNKELEKLDYKAQGAKEPIELTPEGTRRPNTPSKKP